MTGAFAVGKITDEERFDVVRHSCPGAGACGGMYTANTMSSALEVISSTCLSNFIIETMEHRCWECPCHTPQVRRPCILVSH